MADPLFVMICVICVAGVAALFWRLPTPVARRAAGPASDSPAAVAAAGRVTLCLGCFTIVGTRQFAL